MSDQTKIKFCGFTRAEDVRVALELGVWGIGFVFFQESKRAVSAEKVKSILAEVGDHSLVKKVGVFVNPTLQSLERAVATSGINAIQLHGNETPEFCEQVKKVFSGLTLIKAVRLTETTRFDSVDFRLVDSISDTEWGGTGKTIDWSQANRYFQRPGFLAGGLSPENIQTAIRLIHPEGVDVSGGIESAPGLKSPVKMRLFIDRIKEIK